MSFCLQKLHILQQEGLKKVAQQEEASRKARIPLAKVTPVSEAIKHYEALFIQASQGTDVPSRNLFGVTSFDEMNPDTLTSEKTPLHTMANTIQRLQGRGDNLIVGFAGEMLSALTALTGVAIAASGLSTQTEIAFGASGCIMLAFILQKAQTSVKLKSLRSICADYNPAAANKQIENAKLFEALTKADLAVDSTHTLNYQQTLETISSFLEDIENSPLTCAERKQRHQKRVRNAKRISQLVATEIATTHKKFPEIFMNTALGMHDTIRGCFASPSVCKNASPKNAALAGAVACVFLMECAFVGLNGYDGLRSMSASNIVGSSLTTLGAYASLLSLSQLGKEVQEDIKKLLPEHSHSSRRSLRKKMVNHLIQNNAAKPLPVANSHANDSHNSHPHSNAEPRQNNFLENFTPIAS